MDLLEGFHQESLGENIGNYVLSRTVPDLQYIPCDCLSSEMVANVNLLRMGMELVVLSYCDG